MYSYDASVNIEQVKRYSLSSGSNGLVNCVDYTYEADKLISVENQAYAMIGHDFSIISYDNTGNPLSYRGKACTWKRGRCLTQYGNNLYSYNASGVRQEKVVNGITHKYYLEGTTIHKEKRGNDILWYYYDATGITGMSHNGTNYYFQKNLMGATR